MPQPPVHRNHPHRAQRQQQRHHFDVCVVGGGMAGICAAVASARNGARTALLQDRPVLGGNASSEVRMHICGAHGRHVKETGILEEIQLENLRRNPGLLYSLWDSVLYEKVAFCRNLTPFLNCSVFDARTEDRRLLEVTAWQLNTYTEHRITASLFIDCSGDSILGILSGAAMRRGRESREEFGEDIAPRRADLRTMGNTILLQLQEMGGPQPFTAPAWAYVFDQDTHLPNRLGSGTGHNFWWLELGGLKDTIGDASEIQHDLYRTAFGVWDYMKNRAPNREQLTNWTLHSVSTMAGKRESHRMVGPHVLTQNDIRAGGPFADIVGYGGWSMDDHHPAGLYYPGAATLFHPAPSPYGIPFRCLYSATIDNLLCAGRNISTTHAALSSTRVMATCAILGQAAGTAAAIAIRRGCDPAIVQTRHLCELQDTLMEDDCWLPGLTRAVGPLTRAAHLSGVDGDLDSLRRGQDRPTPECPIGVDLPPGGSLEIRWGHPTSVGALRLIGDSNLHDRKGMPHKYPREGWDVRPPRQLPRDLLLEGQINGRWETLHQAEDLCQRLCLLPVQREVTALRLSIRRGWGGEGARLFSLEVVSLFNPKADPLPRTTWHEVMSRVPAEDLVPPELEASVANSRMGA